MAHGVAPTPVRVADVVTRARRPQYAALSSTRLHEIGIRMPPWRDALHRHVIGRPLEPVVQTVAPQSRS